MTFTIYQVVSVVAFATLAQNVLIRWGEMETPEPYYVGWQVLFCLAAFSISFWLLGYLSRGG
jgi:hypothetical protein